MKCYGGYRTKNGQYNSVPFKFNTIKEAVKNMKEIASGNACKGNPCRWFVSKNENDVTNIRRGEIFKF